MTRHCTIYDTITVLGLGYIYLKQLVGKNDVSVDYNALKLSVKFLDNWYFRAVKSMCLDFMFRFEYLTGGKSAYSGK